MALGLLLCGAHAGATTFSGVFFFGDSLTDTGVFGPGDVVGLDLVASYGYDADRWTNAGGTVWAERFAAALGHGAISRTHGGTNYARGGARTDEIAGQIDQFSADHAGIADAGALYVVWAGGNDMLQGRSPSDTVAGMIAAIRREGPARSRPRRPRGSRLPGRPRALRLRRHGRSRGHLGSRSCRGALRREALLAVVRWHTTPRLPLPRRGRGHRGGPHPDARGRHVGRVRLLTVGGEPGSQGPHGTPDGIALALAGTSSVTLQLHTSNASCFSALLDDVIVQENDRFKAR